MSERMGLLKAGAAQLSVALSEEQLGQFETYFQQVQAGAAREELMQLRTELKLERALANLGTAIHGAREGAGDAV